MLLGIQLMKEIGLKINFKVMEYCTMKIQLNLINPSISKISTWSMNIGQNMMENLKMITRKVKIIIINHIYIGFGTLYFSNNEKFTGTFNKDFVNGPGTFY